MPVIISAMVHISFLLCIVMIIVVTRRCPPSQLRTAFLYILGIMALWCASTLLEQDFRYFYGVTNMLFVNICYISICLTPVALLYLGRIILHPGWRPTPVHAGFLLIPLLSIILVFSNPFHHLFFIRFSLYSSDAVYGWYYYFHSLYSYGCIVAGIVMMFLASTRNTGYFSIQSLLVTAGVLITLAPNMLYSFGVLALPFSVSAAAFTVTILCFAIAFLKFRFITALPITLRQVVDLISDGYLVVDREHGVLSYNQALTQLFPNPADLVFGTELAAIIERNFTDFSYSRFLELELQSMMQQGTVSTEANLTGGACVSVEITPVIQRHTHTGSIILLKDITQAKLLIEATKSESRYKSEFLSNMSHEIRTPMNAITGMVSIGRAAAELERKDYCLTRIDEASKHLLSIINDVLDISKIEAGKFELSPIPFAFEGALQRVVDVVKFRADEKQQTLNLYIDQAIPKVLVGDDVRLAQIITNLIGNSVKFTPEQGTISLRTRLAWEENGVCTIQFDVTDTGIGLSPEQQNRLFQSFSQAETDTARHFGGTGLGLSISKKIAEMMGGRIWVKSEANKGATFSFTVQMNRGEAQELAGLTAGDSVTAPAGAAPNLAVCDFTGCYVLLAEDVEINREIVLALLEPTHLVIECAVNGAEAVRMFEAAPEKYAMIFMDVQMPEMDGYEATRAIRAMNLPQAESVPIIAMTANVFKKDIEMCLEAGMDGHLGKPLDFGDVLKVLSQHLGEK